ncbi:MAG: hypothetical protein WCT24_00145 [Patescibacteria group bacterium]
MIQTLLRYTLSIGLGMTLAMSFLGATQLTQPLVAHAQLETSDLLDDDFSDASGLGTADLKETIGNLIKVALGFLGIVAIVIVLMGGFKWMTAGGNDEKVTEAKKLLIAGVIGLAIILASYAITEFVIGSILGATGNS